MEDFTRVIPEDFHRQLEWMNQSLLRIAEALESLVEQNTED